MAATAAAACLAPPWSHLQKCFELATWEEVAKTACPLELVLLVLAGEGVAVPVDVVVAGEDALVHVVAVLAEEGVCKKI